MSEDLIRRSDAIKAIASLHILADEEKIFKVYADNPHSTTTDFEETMVSVFDAIDDAPSIDIVRCKECKYYKQSEAFCENGNGLWQAGDECFCNYGEREGE